MQSQDHSNTDPGFVHLHLHTEYSLLDGAIRLKDLFPKAKEYGYPAVAITDHGNMYGALQFYEQALEHGIKPIIGCEVYVAPNGRRDRSARSARDAAYHLVLLAQNNIGYKNLLKLVSTAYFEGFFYKPRVDLDLFKELNQGIIALSACLHGQIPAALLKGDRKGAKALAETYAEVFDGRFYLEIQENGIAEQTIVNHELVDLAGELGLPLVATNDCHYLSPQDAKAHDVLLCIQTNKTVDDANRMRFSTDKLYFTSPEEMARRFKDYPPEALSNTLEIAKKCNIKMEFGKHHFPLYPLKKGETYKGLFDDLARKGLERRLREDKIPKEKEAEYRERFETEMSVIKEKGFASYFLIVADFIGWAKSQSIPVGPGRGSAAGSLVAYAMSITEIDPVRYGLFFERFLNVERESLPDIDVDFCMNRRDEVIQYVTEKYGGEDFVSQIITFGQMKAKAVIRDVGRALGIPYQQVDHIAKLVPDQLNITLDKAIQLEPRLKKLEEEDPKVAELLTIARSLEGLPRHASTHAAGVVISDRPMVDYLPLTKDQNGGTVTQFNMKSVKKVGLIKFDFLGLKTLTVIDKALKLIKEHLGKDIKLSQIPLDDPETYELLSKGNTTGVFQLESPGMKDLLIRMRPSTFTDIIALVALHRPGPMESGMVDQYVKAKHGETKVTYIVPELEPVLKETYGLIVYQEQVMKIAQVLAGYSLGDGDILRRAMGKKSHEEMAAQRDRFLSGAKKNGIPASKAKIIFDLIEKFAGYGFNKSHSAAYALIAYQTAWLKTHYLVPFMASLLSNELKNTDGVIKFIHECKAQGIQVLPPDVNHSRIDFTVDGESIRFGLAAVKSVGSGAIEAIVQERDKKGPYQNFEDFCSRVDLKKVNKRMLESLIGCGTFDSLGHRRSQLVAVLDDAFEFGQSKKQERLSGQMSLFDFMAQSAPEKTLEPVLNLPDIPEWPGLECLANEKKSLGFYISGHPLDSYRDDLAKLGSMDTARLSGMADGTEVCLGGIVRSKKEILTKRGDRMAFLVLEDLHGSVEVVCFHEIYAKVGDLLEDDSPLWVEGVLKNEDDKNGHKILAKSIKALDKACKERISGYLIELQGNRVSPEGLKSLKEILIKYHGTYPVKLAVTIPDRGQVFLSLPDSYSVSTGPGLSDDVNGLLGYTGIRAEFENR
ncbi:MAG: DNA polymerase III subunit alpha [Nitrospiraceae bacterium]|nr:DNA polymerase III subunit alpha [Nitrospiraceae bacterium]